MLVKYDNQKKKQIKDIIGFELMEYMIKSLNKKLKYNEEIENYERCAIILKQIKIYEEVLIKIC